MARKKVKYRPVYKKGRKLKGGKNEEKKNKKDVISFYRHKRGDTP